MISHLSRREKLGYTAIIGLLLFGAGYVGAHRLRRAPTIVFENAPQPSSRRASPKLATLSPTQVLPNSKTHKALAALHSVSINMASIDELETLPGIGPALAVRILDFRKGHGSFRSVEDLRRVKGIGEKKLAAIKPYLKS